MGQRDHPQTETFCLPLSASLLLRPDAEQVRLKLGTAFIEHAGALWPEGCTPSAHWIRDHVDDLLAVLELPLRRDGQDARRLPHRMHWLLRLLADLGQDTSFDR